MREVKFTPIANAQLEQLKKDNLNLRYLIKIFSPHKNERAKF